MKFLFQNTKTGELCDVIFVVEGKDCHAHKAILAGASPVLKAMLTKGMKESQLTTKPEGRQRIPLEEVGYSIFKQILGFVYVGAISLSPMDAIPLLKAADMYQIKELVSALDELIATNLDQQDLVEMWEIAAMFALPVLSDAMKSLLVKKLRTFSDQCKELPYEAFYAGFNADEFQEYNNVLLIADILVQWLTEEEEKRMKHCDALLECVDWIHHDASVLSMATKKLIPLTPYSLEARNTVSCLLQQSVDLNVKDSSLLSSILSQSEVKIEGCEKAMAFCERIYGFKEAREFATGWRRFPHGDFEVRLETWEVKRVATLEGGASGNSKREFFTTDLQIHLRIKSIERDSNSINAEIKVTAFCFMLNNEGKIVSKRGLHVTKVFTTSQWRMSSAERTILYMTRINSIEDFLCNSKNTLYNAATDSVEIAVLLKVLYQ